MQGKWFGKNIEMGYSKGYQSLMTILKVLKSFGKDGNEVTAYDLSHLIDLSPRQINRLLAKMYTEGKVDFQTFERGNRVGREWWLK